MSRLPPPYPKHLVFFPSATGLSQQENRQHNSTPLSLQLKCELCTDVATRESAASLLYFAGNKVLCTEQSIVQKTFYFFAICNGYSSVGEGLMLEGQDIACAEVKI